jgi:hypothetical protein
VERTKETRRDQKRVKEKRRESKRREVIEVIILNGPENEKEKEI